MTITQVQSLARPVADGHPIGELEPSDFGAVPR
jgi:hypothetical protein